MDINKKISIDMSSLIFTHDKEFIRPQYTMEKKSHRTFSKSIN